MSEKATDEARALAQKIALNLYPGEDRLQVGFEIAFTDLLAAALEAARAEGYTQASKDCRMSETYARGVRDERERCAKILAAIPRHVEMLRLTEKEGRDVGPVSTAHNAAVDECVGLVRIAIGTIRAAAPEAKACDGCGHAPHAGRSCGFRLVVDAGYGHACDCLHTSRLTP